VEEFERRLGLNDEFARLGAFVFLALRKGPSRWMPLIIGLRLGQSSTIIANLRFEKPHPLSVKMSGKDARDADYWRRSR
jgi:hypothetical protein